MHIEYRDPENRCHGISELMDILYTPFMPRTLTLAIAAGVMASQPIQAIEASDQQSEWHCQPRASEPLPCQSSQQLLVSENKSQSGQKAALKRPQAHVGSSSLDWQPLHQLTPAQRASEPFYSCGAYIEPPRPGKDFKGDLNQQPISIQADESSYVNNATATFSRDVVMRRGSQQLQSDWVMLDKDKNYTEFRGHVRFRDKGILLVGAQGDLQLDSGLATLDDATYILYGQTIRGHAAHVVRHEDKTLELTRATYTTCPPGDNGWRLSGRNVNLNTVSGLGVAKHAVVRFENLPVFYTPYISFPLDDRRKTGFLYPTLSHSSDNGADLAAPFYLNIAPNYDATFTPRYMSRRGVLLENEFRYLFGSSQGHLGVAGLSKDQLKSENPFYEQRRWLFNYRQQTVFSNRWTAEVDYAKASDKNYLEDFRTGLRLSSNGPLKQHLSTRYLGGETRHSWQLSVDALQYQNMNKTADDPYNKLPQIKLKGSWDANDFITINYGADYTKFNRDKNWNYRYKKLIDPEEKIYTSFYDEGYGIARANGERLYLETGISLPLEYTYGFIRAGLKLQHVQYRLSNLITAEAIKDLGTSYWGFTSADYTKSPKATVPSFSLDSSLYFDRAITIGGMSVTHTLEPRLKYLYAPYLKEQAMQPVFDTSLTSFSYSSLWRDSRFSGYDRLGDANQLSVGITTSLLEDDGFERVRFGIGQILYFKNRQLWINPLAGSPSSQPSDEDEWELDLNEKGRKLWSAMHESTSPVASELIYNITRTMNLRQDLIWDSNNNEMDSYGLYYQFRPNTRSVINAGYRYLPRADRFVKNSDNRLIYIDPNNPAQGYKTTGNNLSHTDLSLAWPLTNKWSALGRWQYDLTNQRNLEFLTGVEYNSCCYQARLLWRKWIKDDSNIDFPKYRNGIVLQFVLHGLGDLTSGSVKEYLKGIKGYAEDEK